MKSETFAVPGSRLGLTNPFLWVYALLALAGAVALLIVTPLVDAWGILVFAIAVLATLASLARVHIRFDGETFEFIGPIRTRRVPASSIARFRVMQAGGFWVEFMMRGSWLLLQTVDIELKRGEAVDFPAHAGTPRRTERLVDALNELLDGRRRDQGGRLGRHRSGSP